MRSNFVITFPAVIFSDQWGREYWKPHARPYTACAEALAVEPRNLVYVGDNPAKDFINGPATPDRHRPHPKARERYTLRYILDEEHEADHELTSLDDLVPLLDSVAARPGRSTGPAARHESDADVRFCMVKRAIIPPARHRIFHGTIATDRTCQNASENVAITEGLHDPPGPGGDPARRLRDRPGRGRGPAAAGRDDRRRHPPRGAGRARAVGPRRALHVKTFTAVAPMPAAPRCSTSCTPAA